MNFLKNIFYALVMLCLLISCSTSADDDPVDYKPNLKFDYYWSHIDHDVIINYKINNDGNVLLKDCRLKFGVDTDEDTDQKINTYKWTEKIDIKPKETYKVNGFSIDVGTVYNAEKVRVIEVDFEPEED